MQVSDVKKLDISEIQELRCDKYEIKFYISSI